MDAVFRTKVEPAKESKPVVASEQAKPVVSAEPPYLDYQSVNARPYVADHFNLGEHWDDPHGGFPLEVSAIENYLAGKIQNADLPNTKTAVVQELKKLEKLTNVDKEERALIRIETIAAYIKFLNRTEDIKYQIRRYGNA